MAGVSISPWWGSSHLALLRSGAPTSLFAFRSPLLGAGRSDRELQAKRLRYRYLHVPAMLVRSGRRLTLRLPAGHPFLKRLLAALDRLRRLEPPPA